MEMTSSVADKIKFQFELKRVAFKYNKTLKWSCSRVETLEARTNQNGMRIVKDGKDYQELQITNLK